MKAAVARVKASLAALGLALALCGLSLLSGCAHDFLYVPVGPGAAGGPAMRYPIPPTVPQGEAYVTSFGFTDIDLGPGAGIHGGKLVAQGSLGEIKRSAHSQTRPSWCSIPGSMCLSRSW